jgi:PadR family transcriptional regulator PadR
LISERDRYGYEISKEIALRTDNEFQIKVATLYAVFQRLEKRDFIDSYLGSVSNGARRRYYRITEAGRAHLKAEIKNWHFARNIIDIFMEIHKSEGQNK